MCEKCIIAQNGVVLAWKNYEKAKKECKDNSVR